MSRTMSTTDSTTDGVLTTAPCPRTRPRNRWCSQALGEHGVDPPAVSPMRAVSAVLAAAAAGCHVTSDDPAGRSVRTSDDQDRQQRGDGEDDDEAADDRAPPQAALRRRSGHDGQVPCIVSLPAGSRPRRSPATMTSARGRWWCAAPCRAAVLCDRLGERVVDRRGLLADPARQQQDRHDEGDDHQHDDDGDRVADDPAGGGHDGDGSPPQIDSQKSRTGLQAGVHRRQDVGHRAGPLGDHARPRRSPRRASRSRPGGGR